VFLLVCTWYRALAAGGGGRWLNPRVWVLGVVGGGFGVFGLCNGHKPGVGRKEMRGENGIKGGSGKKDFDTKGI